MLKSFGEAAVFLVPMDNVHFKGKAHVIQGMFRTAVVLVAPVEVKAFDFILIIKRTAEDVWQTEALFLFLRRIFWYGESDWKDFIT